jgi:hypothetical protein
MPVCYNNDTTDNILGWDNDASQAIGSTTGEGYQNEGKFMRVENPAATNLMWFAGVVAAGGYCGKVGPKWLDVYEPNGAIMPVHSSLSSTVGRTVFAIRPAAQTFTQPLYAASATACVVVGLAEETVDRSSTNGLCLARISRELFINQGYGLTTNLLVGTGATTGTHRLNSISFESAATGGTTEGLYIRAEALGEGCAVQAIQASTVISNATQAAMQCASFTTTWKTGAIAGAHSFYVAEFKYENQDSTPADIDTATLHSVLRLVSNVSATTPPAANTVYWMSCNAEGADKPDGLLFADGLTDIGAYASTGNAPALATGDIMIPIRLAGTTYYLVALADTGV